MSKYYRKTLSHQEPDKNGRTFTEPSSSIQFYTGRRTKILTIKSLPPMPPSSQLHSLENEMQIWDIHLWLKYIPFDKTGKKSMHGKKGGGRSSSYASREIIFLSLKKFRALFLRASILKRQKWQKITSVKPHWTKQSDI